MKRLIGLILLLSSLFCFSACNEAPEKPVNFYYPVSAESYAKIGSVFGKEVREAAGAPDVSYLITKYLKGPNDPALTLPYPAGTKLIALKMDGDTLTITLTDRFATLSGLELTLACASLSMTCMELTGANTIQIQTQSQTLDGAQLIIMNADNLLFMDDLTTSTATEAE